MSLPSEQEQYFFHKPVMVDEVLSGLCVGPGAVIADVTLGGGSHAEEILRRSFPDGLLIGIDRDEDALNSAGRRLYEFEGRTRFFHARMGELSRVLREVGVGLVDGILADLGVSSFQLDTPERGFSFRKDSDLDMRMDRSQGETAARLIARLSAEELGNIIWEFGEERYARRIARAVAGRTGIKTTGELARVVTSALPPKARYGRIHPATRTFQALRIAVNDEMGELDRFLESAPECLKGGGRLAVISYHSLEDRRVKHSFRKFASGGEYSLPARKAVKPAEAEVAKNPRARSAKLRILERAQSQELKAQS